MSSHCTPDCSNLTLHQWGMVKEAEIQRHICCWITHHRKLLAKKLHKDTRGKAKTIQVYAGLERSHYLHSHDDPVVPGCNAHKMLKSQISSLKTQFLVQFCFLFLYHKNIFIWRSLGERKDTPWNCIVVCFSVPQNKTKAVQSLKPFSSHWFLNEIYLL